MTKHYIEKKGKFMYLNGDKLTPFRFLEKFVKLIDKRVTILENECPHTGVNYYVIESGDYNLELDTYAYQFIKDFENINEISFNTAISELTKEVKLFVTANLTKNFKTEIEL